MSWDIFSKSKIQYFLQKLKDKFVQKETGKGLSHNDFVANNTVLTTDKTPFLTRQTLNPTGFSGYVREKLVGASYAWNQLVQNGNFASTSGWTAQRGTISASNNILSYTLTEVGVADVQNRIERYIDVIQGHKYLLSASFKPAHTTKVGFRNAQSAFTLGETTVPSTTFTRVSAIFNATATTSLNMYWVWVCGDAGYSVGDVNQIKECQVIDLTLAFGSTIADYLYGLSNNGGITKLRDMGCPIDKYTPYGYGLYSSKPSAKKVVGKNLLTVTPYGGGLYNQAIGFDLKVTSNVASYTQENNVISVNMTTAWAGRLFATGILPVGSYRFAVTLDSGSNARSTIYVTDQNLIAERNIANIQAGGYSAYDITLDKPSRIAVFITKNVVGIETATNMMVVKGSDVSTYAPYSCTTYSLGNDELRGKFDLVNGEIVASGDVRESNGEITRKYKLLDLSTLTWTYNSGWGCWTSSLTDALVSSNDSPFKAISDKYEIVKASGYTTSHATNTITSNTNHYLFADNGSTTVSPTGYLIYELATPTTEQSTPFADPMSLVGATTEEYIDTRDIPCPVGAERQYMGQSEDVVEIPSSPLSDGKRVLFAQTSGNETQYYFDTPTLYYKEYVVQGDGTKTYGDLLTELKPYYEALSEDEKTYSKVIMRANATGNECLAFVGNYWYSRMGVNAIGLWIDQIDFQYIKYYRGTNGQAAEDLTNTSAANYTIALRVLTYTLPES